MAQPTSCEPAGPLGALPCARAWGRVAWRWPSCIGAMPPSSAPASAPASGGRASGGRTVASHRGRWASQGPGRALGNRSRGLCAGVMGPNTSQSAAPAWGGPCATPHVAGLGSQRGPGAREAPGAPCQRPDRVTATRGPLHTPHHPSRACRTGRGRCAPPDAMAALPLDLARRPLESAAAQFVPQRFALCGAQEPLQLLGQSVECRHGLTRFSTLTQKGMELIHGVRITGQECTGRPCLPGGSPLG